MRVTLAQRVAEVEVIPLSVGVSIPKPEASIGQHTPPENVYPGPQVYSHFAAPHVSTRARVGLEVKPVSSPEHSTEFDGVAP